MPEIDYTDRTWTCTHCGTRNLSLYGYPRQWCRWCLRKPWRR